MEASLTTVLAVVAVWGALWGSFLNVVVYRLPRGRSVVRPGSACPSCAKPIAPWHNVPVLGFLWLRGRCAHCRQPISWRYPAVEALFALLCVGLALPYVQAVLIDGAAWRPALTAALGEQGFAFALVALALIDAETFQIPDALSLPLPLLGLAIAVGVGDLRGVSWASSASGALVGAGGLFALQWGYAAATGREGLGTGDVKLLAGIGAFVGLTALPLVLLAGALQGLLFGLAYAFATRGRAVTQRGLASLRYLALPFGPFLALAALQWLLLHRSIEPVVLRWLTGS